MYDKHTYIHTYIYGWYCYVSEIKEKWHGHKFKIHSYIVFPRFSVTEGKMFYSKEFCEWKMPSRIPSKEHDKRISFHSHTNVVYLIQLHGKKNMQNTKMNLPASSDPVAAANRAILWNAEIFFIHVMVMPFCHWHWHGTHYHLQCYCTVAVDTKYD